MSITTVVILLLAILVAPVLLIRFRKRWVAAFNLAVTSRITSRFAARLPGFGILTPVGRKSGRVYRTPVNHWCGRFHAAFNFSRAWSCVLNAKCISVSVTK